MRRTLIIGGKEVELEANLGTASFFQEFTGKNILETSSLITGQVKKMNLKNVDLTKSDEELLKSKEIIENVSPLTSVANEMIEVAKRLAYVMHVQTKYGKTKEDISKIRSELTEDDLLAWSFEFSTTAFTAHTYTQLMSFWRDQTEKTSVPKNQ